MEISINAKGPREHVKQEINTQVLMLRKKKEYEHSQPLLAAIGDELSRRVTKAPGTEMELSVDLIIDLKIPKGKETTAADDSIEINGVRVTRAEIDRAFAGQPIVAKPMIGTDAAANGAQISNDDE